jgi:hypothetical protein
MSILDAVAPVRLPSRQELDKYDGLWVAVHNGMVVGHGKTLRTALNRARTQGIANPMVFRAPLRREGRNYY